MVAQRMFLVLGLAGGLVACAGDAPGTAPTEPRFSSGSGSSGSGDSNGSGSDPIRVRCERRFYDARSKISVDGNDLSPRNAYYTARVRSGANTATAPQQKANGDEVGFDFDSNKDEDAVRIAANFIVIDRYGPDVIGEILRNSVVVRRKAVDCEVNN